MTERGKLEMAEEWQQAKHTGCISKEENQPPRRKLFCLFGNTSKRSNASRKNTEAVTD